MKELDYPRRSQSIPPHNPWKEKTWEAEMPNTMLAGVPAAAPVAESGELQAGHVGP